MSLTRLLVPCVLGVFLIHASSSAQTSGNAPFQTPDQSPVPLPVYPLAGAFIHMQAMLKQRPEGSTCAEIGGFPMLGAENACDVEAEEHIYIRGSSTIYNVEFQTVGYDGQFCRISGPAYPSTTPTGPQLTLVTGACQAVIGFRDEHFNTVQLMSNQACRALCNADAVFNIALADRSAMPLR